ncbi:MAG: P-loop NTPase [Gemmatimonadota bacterium]
MSIRHRTYADLESTDASGLGEQVAAQAQRVADRLAGVGSCVAVMSGKGGVGKSLVSAALTAALSRLGLRVGLLDADLVGPTAARLSGVTATSLVVDETGVEPPVSEAGVRVMSMDLLLEDGSPLAWREPDSDSFVWRGAQERGALREFLSDVKWGQLDVLLLDLPPGTQRLVDLFELVPNLAGAIVVTIPTSASAAAVQRSIALARTRGIPLLGIVENMAGYACHDCGQVGELFPGDAADSLAATHSVPVLARIPFDVSAGRAAESGAMGELVSGTEAGRVIDELARVLTDSLGLDSLGLEAPSTGERA